MSCPFYIPSSSNNSLKVCGPKERISYAPSSAHLKIFCLSISSYLECPQYKLKIMNRNRKGQHFQFYKKLLTFFKRKLTIIID